MVRKLVNSGIDWIGNIPSDWKIVKYSRFASSGMGQTILKTDLLNTGIPVYSATQDSVIFGYIDNPRIILKNGDLIIPARGNSIGYVKLVDKECTCTQTTIYSKIDNINSKFLSYYCLGLKDFLFEFDNTAIPQITVQQVQSNPVLLPNPAEQQSIANFLDKKVDKIDKLLQVQKESISKLEEFKQQVISETINFGIEKNNLDEVKYDWIKKMPSHWEIEKVARTTYLKGRIGWQGLKSTEFKTEGPHLVTGTDFNNGYVNWDSCVRVTEQRYDEAKFIQVKEGDLLITKDGTIGKVAIAKDAPEKVSVNSGIFVTRPLQNDYINRYFYYLMLSNVFKEFFQLTLTGNSTILHLYQGVFSQFRYPLPPMNEQIEIVEYLDRKTEEINQLVQIKKDKIEKLNEYKKSLIYEAVTGKIEVM
jgi:type I restriction enzyme S subunit